MECGSRLYNVVEKSRTRDPTPGSGGFRGRKPPSSAPSTWQDNENISLFSTSPERDRSLSPDGASQVSALTSDFSRPHTVSGARPALKSFGIIEEQVRFNRRCQ